MNLILCRFFINMNLGIPGTRGLQMNYDSKKIIFLVNSNKIATHVPFKGINVNWNNVKDGYRSDLFIYNKEGKKMLLQEIFIGNDDRFKYGYKQYGISNIIDVIFEEDVSKPYSNNDNLKEYTRIAKEYLIHFIDMYRYSTQIEFIANPRTIVSPLVSILTCEDSSIECLCKEGSDFKDFTIQVESESANINVFESFKLSNEALDKLQYHLQTDYKIELYEKLIIESKEKAFVYKDYSLSIVLVETAVETFTKKKLIDVCSIHNINTLPLHYRNNQHVHFEEAIESGNIISDLLKGYVNSILGISVHLTNEYKAWKKDTYEKRNKIVHNGISSYGFSDSELAFNSAVSFINYLKKILV
ncbi:hypothetical protein [Clostridium sp. JS66]|uniref:hypothetical protein n=1 Tax=Clostridium sp. JS66 TaxID=3064705 RepID=UPI00298E72DA|nr:hypothetical protein [Clostridium sp. JS66]WPC42369.1 hypothetical protein Q6H37_02585 [Clostridium sp. JS66]